MAVTMVCGIVPAQRAQLRGVALAEERAGEQEEPGEDDEQRPVDGADVDVLPEHEEQAEYDQ